MDLREIDKCRRRFLWRQDEEITGASCKVNWPTVCAPTEHGGLGIPDLQRFGRALRLRWLWIAWHHPERPWVGSELPCDEADWALFSASTKVTIGDGMRASFWRSPWLGHATLSQRFPELFTHSRRKHRSVHDALSDDTWIRDLAHGQNQHLLKDVLALHRELQRLALPLQPGVPDDLTWKHSSSGTYSARSAYQAQFQGRTSTNFDHLLWKAWAPGKIKIFSWLLLRDRLWCNDRLQRRGWPNGYFCKLCVRSLESSHHLFWNCPESRQVCTAIGQWHGCSALSPADCWSRRNSSTIIHNILARTDPSRRHGARSIPLLTCWEIWQERNNCTFRSNLPSMREIIRRIRDSIELWRIAGATCIESPFGEPP